MRFHWRVDWVVAPPQSWGGIKLLGMLAGRQLSDQTIQNYATEFEGHPDNVGASLYGGFVISSVDTDGEVRSIRFDWTSKVKVVVVSPQSQLPTHVARAALSRNLSRTDAVFNLQRTALFTAAVAQKQFEL